MAAAGREALRRLPVPPEVDLRPRVDIVHGCLGAPPLACSVIWVRTMPFEQVRERTAGTETETRISESGWIHAR